MNNCLNCKKELSQTEGKRAKQFCNSTCRSNYWQKMKRKAEQLPKDYGEVKKMAITATKLKIKQEVPPKKEVNQEAKNGFKTLDDLKAACPKDLTGIDRSNWISQQRVKLGI